MQEENIAAGEADGRKLETPRLDSAEKTARLRPLLAEVWRAELRRGGLLFDFGTADQLKATLGGWKSGWGVPVLDEPSSALDPESEALRAAAGEGSDVLVVAHREALVEAADEVVRLAVRGPSAAGSGP